MFSIVIWILDIFRKSVREIKFKQEVSSFVTLRDPTRLELDYSEKKLHTIKTGKIVLKWYIIEDLFMKILIGLKGTTTTTTTTWYLIMQQYKDINSMVLFVQHY